MYISIRDYKNDRKLICKELKEEPDGAGSWSRNPLEEAPESRNPLEEAPESRNPLEEEPDGAGTLWRRNLMVQEPSGGGT